jgi:hypothetical protein
MVHDLERVGARMPKGLLLLNGITETQWEDSLKTRKFNLDSLEYKYYSDIQVLASAYETVDAKLVALSQLPENFDSKTFMDMVIFSYSLCFGYDPAEFWPVQFGSLGRGKEAEVSHQTTTSKGGLEFPIALQEQLQDELPDTLLFEFANRDDEGDILAAELQTTQSGIVTKLYESGLSAGEPLITKDEARQLLVLNKIIPEEWTTEEEKVKYTDVVRVKRDAERRLGTFQVQRALDKFPNDDIVTYVWPSNQLVQLSRFVNPSKIFRAAKPSETVLYDKDGVKIVQADVDLAIEEAKGLNIEPLLTAALYEEA